MIPKLNNSFRAIAGKESSSPKHFPPKDYVGCPEKESQVLEHSECLSWEWRTGDVAQGRLQTTTEFWLLPLSFPK